jgi:ribonuclease HI
MRVIQLWTDGSSRGNPGNGGWGAILKWGDREKELSGGFRKTTNNRMELLAVVEGLNAITRYDVPIEIWSDSKYVVDSVEKGWVFGWEKKNFIGKKNEDLWKRYLQVSRKFKDIKFNWVKGHCGYELNERCDVLATSANYKDIDFIYESL